MNLLNVILSVCITGIMSYFTILNISSQKKNKSDFIVYNLIFIPLFIFSCLYLEGLTRLITNIIFIIASVYLTIFRKDISNSVYYTITYELLAYISEIFISVVFVSIFKINIGSYEKFQFSLLIFSICNSIFIYLLSKSKFICKNVQRLNFIISKNHKDWIYIIIMMILLSFLIVSNKNNLGSGVNYYINVGMVIFVVFSLIYNL